MGKIKMLSLFSGIGAPEKALKNLGFDIDIINYCEIDKFASTSYAAIHEENETLNLKDVSLVEGKGMEDIDILFHGSPCQSFSVAGKKEGGDEGSGTKSSLMWETVRIVTDAKPKIVIWENVKGVLSKSNRHNFDKYLTELESLGYSNSYKEINPRDLGESQNRPRVFAVSVLNSTPFVFPEIKEKNIKPIKDYLEDDFVDERFIIKNENLKAFIGNNPIWAKRTTVKELNDYAYCLVAKSAKACRTNNFILYNQDDYSKNFDITNIQSLIDNNIPVRVLTPLEYWRLQGFTDDDFYKARKALADKYKNGDVTKTDAQLYKQAGNSINVKVLESFLASVLNDHVTKVDNM